MMLSFAIIGLLIISSGNIVLTNFRLFSLSAFSYLNNLKHNLDIKYQDIELVNCQDTFLFPILNIKTKDGNYKYLDYLREKETIKEVIEKFIK